MSTRRIFLKAAASTPFLLSTPLYSAGSPPSSGDKGNFGSFYFGWRPDAPIRRTNQFRPAAALPGRPNMVDLRAQFPTPYDQGQVGSCVSNAIAAAVQFGRRKAQQAPDFEPSRLYIYYFGRLSENTVASDSGLSVFDGISSIKAHGVCPESLWPYDPTPANADGTFPNTSRAALKPRQAAVTEGMKHQAVDAFSITSRGDERIDDLEGCLSDGFPFIFGFAIYSSFFDSQTKLPLSNPPVPPIADTKVGNHAVLAVGYHRGNRLFICRNSWGVTNADGKPMQDQGYFYMPYDYIKDDDLVGGFWTVRAIASR